MTKYDSETQQYGLLHITTLSYHKDKVDQTPCKMKITERFCHH